MRRALLAVLGLVLAATTAPAVRAGTGVRDVAQAPEPATAQAPPAFRPGVDLVAVDVSVVDATGRPVRGLEAGSFSLTVDGKPRRLASVQFIAQETAPRAPLSSEPTLTPFSTNAGQSGGRMVLVVIDLGSIGAGSGRIVTGAVERIFARLGPGDRTALAVIPGSMVVDFTRHHALVRDAVGKMFGAKVPVGGTRRVGITEALAIARNEPGVLQQVADRECGSPDDDAAAACRREIREESDGLVRTAYATTARSLSALRSIIGRLAPIDGSKTVVLISEGLVIDRQAEQISWVSDETSRVRASVYGIRLMSPVFDVNDRRPRDRAELDQDPAARGFDMLVSHARGASFAVTSRGEWAFDRLALEMAGYYLLGFEPQSGDRNGQSHAIGITVNRPGVAVRARPRFVAPPASAARPSDADIITSVLAQPLLAEDVPLRVTVKSFKDAASDRLKLLVAAALGGPAGGTTARAVGFLVTNDRGEVQASSLDTSPSAATPYVGAALVDPGTFNLKLAVVDERGRRGSVEHRFDARLRAGGPFRFSDVVLADGAVGKDLVPAVEPRVSREVVTGYLEIYASDPDRFERTSATFEIARDANAPALAGSPAVLAETADAGWRMVQGSVPVTGLDPGEYVLRSVVSVAGRPVARFSTPFTLVSRAAR